MDGFSLKTYEIGSIPEYTLVLKEIFKNPPPKIWLLEGDLGAGKTTFIKEILTYFGSEDEVNSPTYNIVNEYITKNNLLICHFDLYRIKSEEELLDIGWYDYVQKADFIFIEWPSRAGRLLPENCLHIRLSKKEDSEVRVLEIL